MLLFSISCVLISGLCLVESAYIKQEKMTDPSIFELLKPYLERKCLKNADAHAFSELQDSEKDFQSCLVKSPIPKLADELYNFMCTIVPQMSYECSKSLLSTLEPCLDAEEKYLPNFLLSAFNISIEKRCEGGEEAFKAKLETLKNVKCGDRDSLYLALGVADTCVRKLIKGHSTSELDFVVTKLFFCSQLGTVKQCIMNNLDKVCKDESFSKLVRSDYNIILKWCTKDEDDSYYSEYDY